MSASQLAPMRPARGRLEDFLARLRTAKGLYKKNAGRVHTFKAIAGAEPSGVLFSATADDWDAWAAGAKAAESNEESVAFRREVANDPAAEIVAKAILEELDPPSSSGRRWRSRAPSSPFCREGSHGRDTLWRPRGCAPGTRRALRRPISQRCIAGVGTGGSFPMYRSSSSLYS
jgi:hypothetical protein